MLTFPKHSPMEMCREEAIGPICDDSFILCAVDQYPKFPVLPFDLVSVTHSCPTKLLSMVLLMLSSVAHCST